MKAIKLNKESALDIDITKLFSDTDASSVQDSEDNKSKEEKEFKGNFMKIVTDTDPNRGNTPTYQ